MSEPMTSVAASVVRCVNNSHLQPLGYLNDFKIECLILTSLKASLISRIISTYYDRVLRT